MSIMKNCPSCSRSYSDLSLSFCLEDGSLLSAPFNSENFQLEFADDEVEDKNEEITLVKSSSSNQVNLESLEGYSDFVKNRELLSKKYRKTPRTEKEYPISDSESVFKKPFVESIPLPN